MGQACDFAILQQHSARSARQHKAWGVSPRIAIHNTEQTRGAGDSTWLIRSIKSGVALRLPPHSKSVARSAGLTAFLDSRSWGLLASLAAPQALCCRALRALALRFHLL